MKYGNWFKSAFVSSSLVVLASCGGGAPAVDTTAPTILSTVPASAATGVTANATIQITFSEAMNKAITQTAYQSASSGILPANVTFNWNTAGTVLTITPNALLTINGGSDPATVVARPYAYSITNVATDLAGNPLTTTANNFTTQRRITQDLPVVTALTGEVRADGSTTACVPICVGDSGTAANAQYKGFLSFGITSIPAGVQSFEFANLSASQTQIDGDPYGTLGGTITLDHVNFATLDFASAFSITAPLRTLGALSTTATIEVKTLSVLPAIQDDYAQRVARGNRTQYRLTFGIPASFNNMLDSAGFSATPVLNVRYFLP